MPGLLFTGLPVFTRHGYLSRILFTSVLDYVAPLKEVHSEPWITAEIRSRICERDSWLRKSRKDTHSPDNYHYVPYA